MATIKFYLRTRLLSPGTPTARNQAEYGETHVLRLRFIRALTGVAGMDLSAVRQVLQAVDDDQVCLSTLYERVDQAAASEPIDAGMTAQETADAEDEADRIIAERGWQIAADDPARGRLVQALAVLRRAGSDTAVAKAYARSADLMVSHELGLIPAEVDCYQRAAAVARSIMFEVVLIAARRMAERHHAELRQRAARLAGSQA